MMTGTNSLIKSNLFMSLQICQSVLAYVGDVITKISGIDTCPEISYPGCSAGAVRAPELRFDIDSY